MSFNSFLDRSKVTTDAAGNVAAGVFAATVDANGNLVPTVGANVSVTATVDTTALQAALLAALAGLASSGAVASGTVTATTVAAALPSQACSEVRIQNDGAVDIFVGGAAGQAYRIVAGQSDSFKVTNVDLLYVKSASATCLVNWFSRS
jgi:predicted deacylase